MSLFDEPIPALGNRSPRAMARMAKGREKVAAWLKLLKNQGARQDPGNPVAAYDFGWMWRAFGLEDLRH